MKLRIIILYLLSSSAFGQYNHVKNADFESNIGCPNSANTHHNDAFQPLDIPFVNDWTMPLRHTFCTVGSADYNNICGTFNHCAFGPHSGNGYMEFYMYALEEKHEYKEYFTSQLQTPLVQGHLYYLEFWLSSTGANTQLGTAGLRFTNSRPRVQCHAGFLDGDPPAHMQNNQILNNDGWKRISAYYVADDNYSWITLGDFENRFNSNLGSVKFHCIDDVKVIDVGSSECPEWNVIQNISYTDNIDLIYRSSYITGAGSHVSATDAAGPVSISAQSTITLKSANKVVMEEEFHVNEGGTLHAFIAPCSSDCFFPSANAGPDYTICQKGNFSVGTPSDYVPENTYSWSAAPVSALSYLSCTNCPNPQIILPFVGDFGNIHYTLNVTNKCGETASDEAYIFYDLNAASASPSVNAYNFLNNNFFEFDVTCDAHTEYVYVEVYKNSDNTLVYTKSLHRGDEFFNIPFHWKMDQYLTNCENYTIKIFSKNFCKETLSAIQTLQWIRDRTINITLSPNVFSPPNPPNERLCYGVSGAENYEITVIDPHGGAQLYYATGALNQDGCVWDGSCNGSLANCPGGYVPDGDYAIVVKFWNCENNTQQSQIITVFNDQNKIIQNGDNGVTGPIVSPNPNNGIFNIISGNQFESAYTIEITNSLGSVVYLKDNIIEQNTKINLNNLDKGIYFIRLFNSKYRLTSKIIIQ